MAATTGVVPAKNSVAPAPMTGVTVVGQNNRGDISRGPASAGKAKNPSTVTKSDEKDQGKLATEGWGVADPIAAQFKDTGSIPPVTRPD